MLVTKYDVRQHHWLTCVYSAASLGALSCVRNTPGSGSLRIPVFLFGTSFIVIINVSISLGTVIDHGFTLWDLFF